MFARGAWLDLEALWLQRNEDAHGRSLDSEHLDAVIVSTTGADYREPARVGELEPRQECRAVVRRLVGVAWDGGAVGVWLGAGAGLRLGWAVASLAPMIGVTADRRPRGCRRSPVKLHLGVSRPQ
jgi:hypothetical protein